MPPASVVAFRQSDQPRRDEKGRERECLKVGEEGTSAQVHFCPSPSLSPGGRAETNWTVRFGGRGLRLAQYQIRRLLISYEMTRPGNDRYSAKYEEKLMVKSEVLCGLLRPAFSDPTKKFV